MSKISNTIDVKKDLGDTGFSIEFIITQLYENNEEFKDLLNESSIQNATSENFHFNGYAGKVRTIKIRFENDKIFTCTLKTPSVECFLEVPDEVGLQFVNIAAMLYKKKVRSQIYGHNMACDVYQQLAQEGPTNVYYLQKVDVGIKQKGVILMQEIKKEEVVSDELYEFMNDIGNLWNNNLRHEFIRRGGTIDQCTIS